MSVPSPARAWKTRAWAASPHPRANADAFAPGGWFRSGDIASVDARGHYRILDRLKDMFISGGENVYPAEVEAALFAHPSIAEAAVIGVPDDRWGEVGRAFVVAAPGCEVRPGELRGFLAERLAGYQIPAHFTVLPELPHTASNKVRESELRRLD